MADTIDSGKIFFHISDITGQICMGFEVDTPEKGQQHAHCIRLSDKDLVKKVIDEQPKHSVAQPDLFLKIAKMGMMLLFFRGNCIKPNSNTEISQKDLPNSRGFDKYPPF